LEEFEKRFFDEAGKLGAGCPLCVGLMINVMKVQECDASKFNSCSAV